MYKLFAVAMLVAVASEGRADNGSAVTTPTIDFILVKGTPEYVNLSNKKWTTAPTGSNIVEKNLQSWVIAYKAWGQMGDFVATPEFYYELDQNALMGSTRRVVLAAISKYPDLVERYNAIRPWSVNYTIGADVSAKSQVGTRRLTFKVVDRQLVYFGSRSNKNYSSPGSPAKWKYGVSDSGGGPNAFTDRDETDDNYMRKLFREIYRADVAWVSLEITWPGDEIDGIAKDFDEYEKKQKDLDKRAKDIADDAAASPRRIGGDWDKPAPIPVKVELDQDLDNTTTEEGVVELSGTLTGPARALESAKIIAEGYEQQFAVDDDGKFSNKVVLKAGLNRIKLQAGSKTIEQRITLDRAPSKLRATLVWDGKADLDLHVTSPSGAEVYYSNKSSHGMTLDVDNTKGFGPENVYVSEAEKGEYRIAVQNFSGGNGRTATVYIYVGEKLRETKRLTFSSAKETLTAAKVKL